MSTNGLDHAQYKSRQVQTWDGVAAAWDRWWPAIEKGFQSISDHMISSAAIKPGHRVLDVATGIGEPAFTAARAVGQTGRVVATDQSPQMLEIAQRRGKDLGETNVEFREMDAEQLDFPEASFDAALCRWGLMFLPDLSAALDNLYRLLQPGGRMVAAVWSEPAKVPMLRLAGEVVRQYIDLPTPPPGAPDIFGLAGPDALQNAFVASGFTGVTTERKVATLELPSCDDYANFTLDIAGPLAAAIAQESSEIQAKIRHDLAQAVGQYASADGSISIPNETLCVSGTK
ncbi:MAG: class I SAM-dependent methyltransferase [Chloroflexi bacterium]|nr:class I SAM-dependent methyltransferase [Chloroflexota bacterium]